MLTEIIGYFMADSDKKAAERDAQQQTDDQARAEAIAEIEARYAAADRAARVRAWLKKATPYIIAAIVVLFLFYATRKTK